MGTESDQIDEAVLAPLWLNLDSTGTVWKGFDWQAMERLRQRGFISNPVGKSKSVQLTVEGLAEGQRLSQELFAQPQDPSA